MADLIDKSLAVSAVRQALVDAAHTHGSTMVKASSAMFKAETYATNALAALPPVTVGMLTDAQIDAALDAMEIQFGFDGVENSIPWRQLHPDKQSVLRSAVKAAILAALTTKKRNT